MKPSWYAKRYPTLDDLVDFAASLGAHTHFSGKISTAAFVSEEDDGNGWAGAARPITSIILIPSQKGPLASAWGLAHEIGHLCLHAGPGGSPSWSKDETQANRWAACALIPAARIKKYNNASIDSFMGALSANYELLPMHDCLARDLAHKIARFRLDALATRQE